MTPTRAVRLSTFASALLIIAWTAGAVDVPVDKVKRIPPAGVAVPPADRAELEAGIAQLGREIEALQAAAKAPKAAPAVADLIPDIQIFHNAARYALAYDEFFKPDEINKAKALLKEGLERAKELREGQPAWASATGLVVRGYVSKIDGSVQPYGLVVPESVGQDRGRPHRLDIWYHGRGETLSETNFLSEHMRSAGEFTPRDAIVLHPYGRYCNANRFAGEVDTFEALESVKKRYAIDDNRILVRGFSMGGAACWMMATHHAGLWAAAAPGAGFSETAGFLHITDLSTVPDYQQKLWHWYDSTDRAINLFNCPTVAYSGENDGQKQAADMMEKALADEHIAMAHVIGAKAKHFYTPEGRAEVNRRLDAIAAQGRNALPAEVKFATWSLRYNAQAWVTVDALDHHWEQATVDARIVPGGVQVTTKNVAGLTLSMAPGTCPFDVTSEPKVTIDGVQVSVDAILSDRSWTTSFVKGGDAFHDAGHWTRRTKPDEGLRKRHGLQGPIDDAFMDAFIMVRPTGKALNEKVAAWVDAEQKHAIEHWRRQFRGEARVKDDAAITEADIASANLVLWGDPSSNAILAKIADKLPITWDAQAVHVGDKTFSAGANVPVLIYPNPLNSNHYVVLNSGFTFREYDYENNARQTPKLPDWAVVDIAAPPSAQSPGGIAAAGFFGERWEMPLRGIPKTESPKSE